MLNPFIAKSIYDLNNFGPSEDIRSQSISVGIIDPTNFTLYFARVIATFNRRSPPTLLSGPKFIRKTPLGSFA